MADSFKVGDVVWFPWPKGARSMESFSVDRGTITEIGDTGSRLPPLHVAGDDGNRYRFPGPWLFRTQEEAQAAGRAAQLRVLRFMAEKQRAKAEKAAATLAKTEARIAELEAANAR